MSEKLVEQSLQLNVKALIRDANKSDSLYEKKELLESAHTYAESLEDKKLFEETSKLLEGINSELQVLSEKGMETDDLKKTVEELTADKEKLEKELAELKDEKEKVEEQVKTISEMYESKQYEASEDELLKNRRLSKEVCGLKLRVRNQERELVSMKKRNKSLKEKCVRLEASANSKVEADKYVLLEQENQKLANRNSNLSKSVQSMRESSLRNNRPQRSVDRFDRMRDSIKENRLPKKEEVKIVESTSINEDDIMEKMLGN